jgi:hypothetical protein
MDAACSASAVAVAGAISKGLNGESGEGIGDVFGDSIGTVGNLLHKAAINKDPKAIDPVIRPPLKKAPSLLCLLCCNSYFDIQ